MDFANEVIWLIEGIDKQTPRWEVVGFIEAKPELMGEVIQGYPVLGDSEWLKEQDLCAACGIGNSKLKEKVMEPFKGTKTSFPSLIHPSAIISSKTLIGEGAIITAGCVISIDVEIGKFVLINWNCTIGHDVKIGNYSTILPGSNVSGYVNIGKCADVGTGTKIIPNVRIGENTIIGAGAVVTRDIPSNCTAVGMPAKPIKWHL